MVGVAPKVTEITTVKEAVDRDGFVGPFESLLSSSHLDRCRDLCERIVSERPRHPLYGRYSVRDWHLVHPEILELLTQAPLVDRLTHLLGPDLTLWRSKIFYKKPGEGELGWHQEVGLFAGDEIGNDKPALRPSHAPPTSRKWSVSSRPRRQRTECLLRRIQGCA